MRRNRRRRSTDAESSMRAGQEIDYDPYADHVISINYERFIEEDKKLYDHYSQGIRDRVATELDLRHFQRTAELIQLAASHRQEPKNLGGSIRKIGAKQTILKSFRLKAEEECAICMESFVEKDKITQLACNEKHFFHHDCLQLWIQKKKASKQLPRCVLCRAIIDTNKMTQMIYKGIEEEHVIQPQDLNVEMKSIHPTSEKAKDMFQLEENP